MHRECESDLLIQTIDGRKRVVNQTSISKMAVVNARIVILKTAED